MRIEYTKEGMKIIHPTGVVQILSIEDLTRLKNSREQHKAKIETAITRTDADISEVEKWQR